MKNPFSFKVLYLLTRISYWGSLTLIVVVFLAGIFMLTLDPQQMKLGFPANLSFEKEVNFLTSNENIPVVVDFSSNSIDVPVKHLGKNTISMLLTIWLIILVCISLIAKCFLKFMQNVMKGNTFESDNINHLKRAALGLVGIELLSLAYGFFGQFIISSKFDLGDISNKFSLSFPSTPIILALALWALAHIFTKGKELEDEQKLTV